MRAAKSARSTGRRALASASSSRSGRENRFSRSMLHVGEAQFQSLTFGLRFLLLKLETSKRETWFLKSSRDRRHDGTGTGNVIRGGELVRSGCNLKRRQFGEHYDEGVARGGRL